MTTLSVIEKDPLENRIQELDQQLDELLEEKYFLEQKLDKERLIRTELQEFLGNIYYSCQSLLEDDSNKIEAGQLIRNLTKNIKDFTRTYKIDL